MVRIPVHERVSIEVVRVDGWIHTHVFVDGELDETMMEHEDDYTGASGSRIEDICANL